MATQPANDTEERPEDYILYEVRDGVAWVSLNRPRYHNTQNFRLLDRLEATFRRAVDDDEVKVIVLKGEGKNFSAGHDLGTPGKDKEMIRPRADLWYDHSNKPGAELQWALEQDAYLGLCRRWQAIPKPMIAQVQGACIAGGLMLAWVCDLIVASEDAYFQDPVMMMGVPGVEYFAHAFELPPRIAREFLLLGRKMSAQRAYQYGMVNEVVAREKLEETVADIAADLAKKPRFGMALAKQAFNFIEDLRGKRTAMDGVFHMHHLAHAHNWAVSGNGIGGLDAKAMAAANKAQDKQS